MLEQNFILICSSLNQKSKMNQGHPTRNSDKNDCVIGFKSSQ